MDAAEALKMFWPVILLAVALAVIALYDLYKRENVRGSKAMWAFIIIVIGTIGPILYFALGREK
ncbi:MAG: PLDc_N domain-containing protein [Theionarchaea archaeon]|nr:PLDc_N domain-containing protein [Theionarchaea archaeon]